MATLEATNIVTVGFKKPVCLDEVHAQKRYVTIAKGSKALSLKEGAALDYDSSTMKYTADAVVSPAAILLEDVELGTDADVTATVLVAGEVDKNMISNVTLTDAVVQAMGTRGIFAKEVN